MGKKELTFAAVIGMPVSHSLSPEIFGFLSRATGRPIEYLRLPIRPTELQKAVEAFASVKAFRGWNVTIPHKERISSALHRLDPHSRTIGAVNVVRFHSGKAVGYNTDFLGVQKTLVQTGFRPEGRKIVVFGAGGAALAAGYALGLSGAAEVCFCNRTLTSAKKAAARLSRRFRKTRFSIVPLSRPPRDADLYINATPLGMRGFPASPKLPKNTPKHARFFDMVYSPRDTAFLNQARSRRGRTIDGLEMLTWQAIATWKIWFGTRTLPTDLTRVQRGLRAHLAKVLETPRS